MTLDEENWVRGDHLEYDESRYDPDDIRQTDCLQCGTRLTSAGGRAGAITWCPECDVTVMLI